MLGLCEGRPPLRRLRSASGNVPITRAIEGASIRRRIPNYSGILQADAFGGYTKLYRAPAKSWAYQGIGLLGPCPAPVLNHGGS